MSKQYRNSNVQISKQPNPDFLWVDGSWFGALGFLSLGFVSDFDIRYSSFELSHSLCAFQFKAKLPQPRTG
jgi:hypothetical protein